MENFLLNDIKYDIVSLYSIVNDLSNWHDDVYGQLHEKPKKNQTNKHGLAACEFMTILLLFLKIKLLIILKRIIKNFFKKCKKMRDLLN